MRDEVRYACKHVALWCSSVLGPIASSHQHAALAPGQRTESVARYHGRCYATQASPSLDEAVLGMGTSQAPPRRVRVRVLDLSKPTCIPLQATTGTINDTTGQSLKMTASAVSVAARPGLSL
jgi:hypothetical protein